MKRIATFVLILAALALLSERDLFGRGGGGGGRGGGGGGARGGGGYGGGMAAGRSPAMGGGGMAARPSTGYARPSTGAGATARPGTGAAAAARPGVAARPAPGAGVGAAAGRPSAGQLNNFLDVPRASTGAVGAATRPAGGGAAAEFLGGSAAQLPAGPVAGRPAVGAAAIAARPGVGAPGVSQLPAGARQQFAANRPARVENRQEWQSNRQQRRDEVRNQVAENHPRLDFWSDHPNWAAWRINRPYRWATWGALTGWLGGYGWTEPTAYSYGDNVYYAEDQVYYGDQPVASTEEYAQQAETIAAGGANAKPESSEWLPLGVFALTQDGQASGTEPTLFMQLAISKEGVISGTLKNTSTGQEQALEGMADKATQRVAWTVAGQKRPILETGISNLTQDESPALIHFADGQTQQWLLVRLPEPKQ